MARDKGSPASRSAPGEGAISIIGPGMTVTGDLETEGTVRIEGVVEGTVRAGKAVVLGKEGRIKGDVFTQDAVIGGRLQGTLTAESRLELQATSVIDGSEIRAPLKHLKLDEGASFNGQIQMIEPGHQPGHHARPGSERSKASTRAEHAEAPEEAAMS
ncbi:MAG: bactofilin family protein [Longimicrobiaceae bacterium]